MRGLRREVEAKKRAREEDEGREAPSVPSFAAPSAASAPSAATGGPVGLLTADEFRAARAARTAAQAAAEAKEQRQQRQQSLRAAKAARARVSFMEEEEEQEEQDGTRHEGSLSGQLGKDPSADTAFLPDREREMAEQRLRQELADRWEAEQTLIKDEMLLVTFSFWDGKGSRRALRIRKGSTIGEFLAQVKNTIEDIRHVSTSNLLFVKEDMIIPQHFTFYELITTKARGKNGGSLHVFDGLEGIKADGTVDKQESHTAKVCERRWYEQNKHIFPASRWEVYAGPQTQN